MRSDGEYIPTLAEATVSQLAEELVNRSFACVILAMVPDEFGEINGNIFTALKGNALTLLGMLSSGEHHVHVNKGN